MAEMRLYSGQELLGTFNEHEGESHKGFLDYLWCARSIDLDKGCSPRDFKEGFLAYKPWAKKAATPS